MLRDCQGLLLVAGHFRQQLPTLKSCNSIGGGWTALLGPVSKFPVLILHGLVDAATLSFFRLLSFLLFRVDSLFRPKLERAIASGKLHSSPVCAKYPYPRSRVTPRLSRMLPKLDQVLATCAPQLSCFLFSFSFSFVFPLWHHLLADCHPLQPHCPSLCRLRP